MSVWLGNRPQSADLGGHASAKTVASDWAETTEATKLSPS